MLDTLFSPKSIAIVGVSSNPQKIGHIVLKNIQEGGYKGKIAITNPKEEIIRDLKSYTSYKDVSFVPDLAIVCIPADLALMEVSNIAEKGTKNILIYSAGYKEIGEEGLNRENKLKELAKKHKLNILGPNCLGFVNNSIKLNATFGHSSHSLGNLTFISQSGAIASSLFDWFNHTGLGFDLFITIGNKTCIGENDILSYLENSNKSTTTKVKPIGMYLESIQNGIDLYNLLNNITNKQPVFILKPGKSDSAKKAMQSHTGAIAGEDKVFDSALKQVGAIRCDGIEDLFDLSKGFAWEDAPKGPEIAIISNAGGPAVISADFINKYGLSLAKLSLGTIEILESSLPRTASTINPIDILGDALVDRYEKAIKSVLEDKNVSGVIILLTPQIMTEIDKTAEIIGHYSKEFDKPILCSFIGGNLIDKAEQILNSYHVPNFRYPERAIKTMSLMWKWKKHIHEKNRDINNKILQSNINLKSLSTTEAFELNKNIRLNIPDYEIIEPEENKIDVNTKIKFPVIMKISSPSLLHKTELGGVSSIISSDSQLKKTYTDLVNIININKIHNSKIIIQKFVEKGVELIIGCKKDPSFGPILTIGAGGILTELLKDHSIILIPASVEYIGKSLESLKIYSLIKGYRKQKPLALDQLTTSIFRLTDFFLKNPNIEEIEVNPLILTDREAYCVDLKIISS